MGQPFCLGHVIEQMRLFLLLFVVLHYNLSAQELVFTKYTTADGLPSAEVHCIHQDTDGFMWFGTDAGLVRFDGSEFRVFDSRNDLPDNVIFKISEDYAGKLWVATMEGHVGYMEHDRYVSRLLPDTSSTGRRTFVQDLSLTKDGVIGISYSNGVFRRISEFEDKRVGLNKEHVRGAVFNIWHLGDNDLIASQERGTIGETDPILTQSSKSLKVNQYNELLELISSFEVNRRTKFFNGSRTSGVSDAEKNIFSDRTGFV